MGKRLYYSICLLFLSTLSFTFLYTYAQTSETWELDDLTTIGGHTVTIYGSPAVVSTDSGAAIEFHGAPDQLVVDANPIGTAKEYTVEMIFQPAFTTEEPRVIHIGDTSGQGERVMMETRITPNGKEWYLDGYMKTDASTNGSLTLVDTSLHHPLDEWAHVALTFKDDTLRTYVNGEAELSGYVTYATDILDITDKTSIGSRMNRENYFKGYIRTLKVTQAALSPDSFLCNPSSPDTNHTGTFEYIDSESLRVYPNPANDKITIEAYANQSADLTIHVIDVLGTQRMIVKKYLSHGKNTITQDVSKLKEGIYFICQTNFPNPIMLRIIR